MEKSAWIFAWLGMIFQFALRIPSRLKLFGFIEEYPVPAHWLMACGWLGNIMLIVSLIIILRSKKRCWAWGLLGIFSFVGMIVVALLKRRVAEGAE